MQRRVALTAPSREETDTSSRPRGTHSLHRCSSRGQTSRKRRVADGSASKRGAAQTAPASSGHLPTTARTGPVPMQPRRPIQL
eukprot:20059-Pyramimonas_sp.AAC.1